MFIIFMKLEDNDSEDTTNDFTNRNKYIAKNESIVDPKSLGNYSKLLPSNYQAILRDNCETEMDEYYIRPYSLNLADPSRKKMIQSYYHTEI